MVISNFEVFKEMLTRYQNLTGTPPQTVFPWGLNDKGFEPFLKERYGVVSWIFTTPGLESVALTFSSEHHETLFKLQHPDYAKGLNQSQLTT